MRPIYNLYKTSYSGLPKAVWQLSAVIFINRAGSMVTIFLMLYLTQELKVSTSTAGQIISIYGIGAIFGTILGGWLTDELGPSRVQLFSLFGSGTMFIVLSFIKSVTGISLMIFILALVTEAFRPANSTAVAEASTPPIRARAYALNRLAINLGFAIGPVVGGFLATINYSYLFWVDGLTCFAAGIFLFIMYWKELSKIHHVSENDKNHRIKMPWNDLNYLFLLLLLFISGVIFFQLFGTWPLDLKENFGLVEDQIGRLMAINGLIIILVEMPLVHKLEKFDPIKTVAYGALLIGIGFSLLPFGSTTLWVAFTVTIWTFGEMLCFPFVVAFIANRASDANRGKYMGMMNFTFSLSTVAAPSLGAFVFEKYGSKVLWLSIGLLGFILYFGFVLVKSFLKHEFKQ